MAVALRISIAHYFAPRYPWVGVDEGIYVEHLG